jgi:SAM-dependent methyltransferase
LAFVNPRPRREIIGRYYPENYYARRTVGRSRRKQERRVAYLHSLQPGRVLDVGCANGAFLKAAADRGWETYGVDVTAHMQDLHGQRLVRAGLASGVFRRESFDVVTAWAVMEHVHTPKAYFREIAALLKPGGHFIFLVPNCESLWSNYLHREPIPRHLYMYSEATLERYLATAGLRLSRIEHSNRMSYGGARGLLPVLAARTRGMDVEDYRRFRRHPLREKLRRHPVLWVTLSLAYLLDRLIEPFVTRIEILRRRNGSIVVVAVKPCQPNGDGRECP